MATSTQDLIVSNQESDDLTILRNKGNGNFVEPATSPEPAGDVPVSVAPADLDGDGDIDLAIANAIKSNAPDDVTILLNRGTGNFVAAPTSPENAGNKPVSIVAANLDGDGDVDLAVANQQGNNITVFRNNGSANFTEAPGSPETAAASRRTSSPLGWTLTRRPIWRSSTRARARRTSRSCATTGSRTSSSPPPAPSRSAGAR